MMRISHDILAILFDGSIWDIAGIKNNLAMRDYKKYKNTTVDVILHTLKRLEKNRDIKIWKENGKIACVITPHGRKKIMYLYKKGEIKKEMLSIPLPVSSQ